MQTDYSPTRRHQLRYLERIIKEITYIEPIMTKSLNWKKQKMSSVSIRLQKCSTPTCHCRQCHCRNITNASWVKLKEIQPLEDSVLFFPLDGSMQFSLGKISCFRIGKVTQLQQPFPKADASHRQHWG